MKTKLASRNRFAIIDESRQTILVTSLVTAKLGLPSKLTREVPFARVEAVYVDLLEDSRLEPDEVQIGDGDGQHLQVKSRWVVGVQLKDGETVTLYEEVTDQPARDISDVSPRTSYYQSLAKRISAQLGKPLMQMAPAPSAPRSFIEAIDQILQHRLEQSGLARRSVHVRGKGLGVEIWVDSRIFETLDEVRDQEARALIQSAIEEWQSGVT